MPSTAEMSAETSVFPREAPVKCACREAECLRLLQGVEPHAKPVWEDSLHRVEQGCAMTRDFDVFGFTAKDRLSSVSKEAAPPYRFCFGDAGA